MSNYINNINAEQELDRLRKRIAQLEEYEKKWNKLQNNDHPDDTTEKKLAEIDIQISEQRFREIFNNMKCGVIILKKQEMSNEFIIVDINRVASKIISRDKSSTSGDTIKSTQRELLDLGLFDRFLEIWNSGKPFQSQVSMDRLGSERLWLDMFAYKINTQEIIVVFEDITERKKTEESIRTSELELREANAAKDKFFSIIAHDLKNSFSGFITLSETLMRESIYLTTDEITELSKDMHESTLRLYSLLENLLQWARSQTGKIRFSPEKVDLSFISQNNVSLLKANASKKNISLSSKIEPGTFVLADVNMLLAILRNLVLNAIKFTPVNGAITLKSKNIKDFIEIAVEDTGIGIELQDLDKLFRIDVHHSTIGTSEEKGSGLGLILCKEFVERHGGSITAESQPGKGTTFKFTLPKSKSN